MKVRLISVTQPCIAQKKLSAEELIVYIARVSNPANQLNVDTTEKLLAYLIDNKHWSPFEMVDLTVEIITSRAIAHQILRHRSFSFQEFSQRYAKVVEMEPVKLRYQADKNRQSSTTVLLGDEKKRLDARVQAVVDAAMDVYDELLNAGVAKECARFVLPETMQTTLYMKGSVRSWIHYLQVRCDEHTQLEHRQVAESVWEIFKTQFPHISIAAKL